jgi:hypothetical protein
LLGSNSNFAQNYQFKSIEIKELSFRLDGVRSPITLIDYPKNRKGEAANFSLPSN